MMLKTIGIDLAKNVFQVCGVNEHMKPQFNKCLKRNHLIDFMRQQAPTMVVMEACYSSHYWGCEMAKLGHDVKLIPVQHVASDMNKMGGITKRGDRYLRKQLVHGARSVVSRAVKKTDPLSLWATKLRVAKPFNKVAVAVAHRLARLIWIMLTRQEYYRAMPTSLEVSG
jgi:transposase